MYEQREKNLLRFIKYSPIIFTTIIAIFINVFIYTKNSINFEKEIEEYKKNYIADQKLLAKSEVEKAYKDILIEKNDLDRRIRNNLKLRINEAYSIIENIYNTYKHLGNDKVIEIIKTALRNIRFNGNRGYYYINNTSGYSVLHPINPSLEGKYVFNIKDKRDVYFLQEIHDNLKTKDAYYSTFYWNKPKDLNITYEKLSYNKIFKPLNLIIGTGDYKDEFTNDLKKHMLKEHIQKISYGKNGYVFVVDYEGNYLAHIKRAYIGKNRINLIDKNGFEITKQIIDTAKKGNGYVRYIGTIMPETGRPAMKTTYVVGFQDWEWAIATGFYDKELYRNLKEKQDQLEFINHEYMEKTLLISSILAFCLILISIYISKVLEKYFAQYHSKILYEINNNRKKDSIMHQQSKMASMGEMIGNIAHQWRQPLSVISTAASGIKLEKEYGISNEQRQNEALDVILDSTSYLSNTIDDFKNFFSPDKLKTKLNTQNIYEKIIKLISSRLSNCHVDIESDISSFEITTYENEFIQSVINILNNSIDALNENNTDEKLIFLDIKNINKHHDEIGNYLELSVTDNAGGIQEEIIDKVFELYFTTKHKSQGTGLGLYMSYEIISKNLNGKIEVKNVEYEYKNKQFKGAQFSIILPLDNK